VGACEINQYLLHKDAFPVQKAVQCLGPTAVGACASGKVSVSMSFTLPYLPYLSKSAPPCVVEVLSEQTNHKERWRGNEIPHAFGLLILYYASYQVPWDRRPASVRRKGEKLVCVRCRPNS